MFLLIPTRKWKLSQGNSSAKACVSQRGPVQPGDGWHLLDPAKLLSHHVFLPSAPIVPPDMTHPVHSKCPCSTMPCCSAALSRNLSGLVFILHLLKVSSSWTVPGRRSLTLMWWGWVASSIAPKACRTPQPQFPAISPTAYLYGCRIMLLLSSTSVCVYVVLYGCIVCTQTHICYVWIMAENHSFSPLAPRRRWRELKTLG